MMENSAAAAADLKKRLAKALLCFTSGLDDGPKSGVLVQVWMPEACADGGLVLTSQGLPFAVAGVGDLLALFRCVSVRYRFSSDVMKPTLMGAIGRVFASHEPEMSNNLQKYDKQVYLRVSEAQRCRVHTTLVMPIFTSEGRDTPVAVFELVQGDRDVEFASLTSCLQSSLKSVHLFTTDTEAASSGSGLHSWAGMDQGAGPVDIPGRAKRVHPMVEALLDGSGSLDHFSRSDSPILRASTSVGGRDSLQSFHTGGYNGAVAVTEDTRGGRTVGAVGTLATITTRQSLERSGISVSEGVYANKSTMSTQPQSLSVGGQPTSRSSLLLQQAQQQQLQQQQRQQNQQASMRGLDLSNPLPDAMTSSNSGGASAWPSGSSALPFPASLASNPSTFSHLPTNSSHTAVTPLGSDLSSLLTSRGSNLGPSLLQQRQQEQQRQQIQHAQAQQEQLSKMMAAAQAQQQAAQAQLVQLQQQQLLEEALALQQEHQQHQQQALASMKQKQHQLWLQQQQQPSAPASNIADDMQTQQLLSWMATNQVKPEALGALKAMMGNMQTQQTEPQQQHTPHQAHESHQQQRQHRQHSSAGAGASQPRMISTLAPAHLQPGSASHQQQQGGAAGARRGSHPSSSLLESSLSAAGPGNTGGSSSIPKYSLARTSLQGGTGSGSGTRGAGEDGEDDDGENLSSCDDDGSDDGVEDGKTGKGGGVSNVNRVAGGAGKRLRFEELQSQFGLGLKDAAHNLGICATTLKRACRRHGIKRWPRRQIIKFSKALTLMGYPASAAAAAAAPGQGGVNGASGSTAEGNVPMDVSETALAQQQNNQSAQPWLLDSSSGLPLTGTQASWHHHQQQPQSARHQPQKQHHSHQQHSENDSFFEHNAGRSSSSGVPGSSAEQAKHLQPHQHQLQKQHAQEQQSLAATRPPSLLGAGATLHPLLQQWRVDTQQHQQADTDGHDRLLGLLTEAGASNPHADGPRNRHKQAPSPSPSNSPFTLDLTRQRQSNGAGHSAPLTSSESVPHDYFSTFLSGGTPAASQQHPYHESGGVDAVDSAQVQQQHRSSVVGMNSVQNDLGAGGLVETHFNAIDDVFTNTVGGGLDLMELMAEDFL